MFKKSLVTQALEKLAARKSLRQLLEIRTQNELLNQAQAHAQRTGAPVPGWLDDSASHFMVQRADPSRGLPERVIGGIRLDGDNQVHASFMDTHLRGMGLAPKMYKDVARKVGGKIMSDRLQTVDSFETWNSMARRAAQDYLRSSPQRPVVYPSSLGYRSGGSYMNPGPPGDSNWTLRMPSKSVDGSAGGGPDPTLSQLYPFASRRGSREAVAFAQSGYPFAPSSSLANWTERPRNIRGQLGQPDFPAPNPKGSFAQFDRKIPRPSVNDTPVDPLNSKRALLREAMRERFAKDSLDWSTGIKELREKFRDRKVTQDRPQVLRPQFGNPGSDRPTGYTVRSIEDMKRDPRDLAGRTAPALQKPPPPPAPPGTWGGFTGFTGFTPPSAPLPALPAPGPSTFMFGSWPQP